MNALAKPFKSLLLAAVIGASAAAHAQPAAKSGAPGRPVDLYRDVRGAIVYKTYCVLCHGPLGDGKGRAARHLVPPPANLTTTRATDEYKESIIRKGGEALGRSEFMPPWEQELTTEQIQDVVFYLRIINNSSRL